LNEFENHMEILKVTQTDKQTDGWTDRQRDRHVDRQKNRWTDRQIKKLASNNKLKILYSQSFYRIFAIVNEL